MAKTKKIKTRFILVFHSSTRGVRGTNPTTSSDSLDRVIWDKGGGGGGGKHVILC